MPVAKHTRTRVTPNGAGSPDRTACARHPAMHFSFVHLRPRSWMPASTTKAPLPNRCIPVAAFSKSTDALGIVPPTPKLNVFMRHLQPKRTPTCNFWAVSQAESARNATIRRRFPRSEKPTANDPRRKPHRSPGPWRNRRASDIAGSYPQARPQQPPAPTANGAPTATWTHPCSRSSRIGGQLGLRISMTNTPTTAIMIPQHTSDEEKGFSEK